jgi:hypothetical protein
VCSDAEHMWRQMAGQAEKVNQHYSQYHRHTDDSAAGWWRRLCAAFRVPDDIASPCLLCTPCRVPRCTASRHAEMHKGACLTAWGSCTERQRSRIIHRVSSHMECNKAFAAAHAIKSNVLKSSSTGCPLVQKQAD